MATNILEGMGSAFTLKTMIKICAHTGVIIAQGLLTRAYPVPKWGGYVMSRHQTKLTPCDLKYIAIETMYNPRTTTAAATLRHRDRGRMRRRLNIGKFESRRQGNDEAYLEAAVNEVFRILGV